MHKLTIRGMTCAHCERAVKEALEAVPGATDVRVDLASGEATVDGAADVQSLVRAVEDEGYRATVGRSA